MKQTSPVIKTTENSGCNPHVSSPGLTPDAGVLKVDNLPGVNIRELNKISEPNGGCDPRGPNLLPDQGSSYLPAHGDMPAGMSDQPAPEANQSRSHKTVQTTSSERAPTTNMHQTRNTTPGHKSPAVIAQLIMRPDSYVDQCADVERITHPLSCGSPTADALAVLSSSIEKSLQSRNEAQAQESKPQVSAARRVRGIPKVNSFHEMSTLLTLVENQELTISPSSRTVNEPVAQPPIRMSPAMMGRRHSMDSNIERSRPPTFVRTYREVKWKRVSKPSKLKQLPRTPSMEDLAAAAGASDAEAESREYITGTHIIRQRVPIFMTSRDPPDPMGRRFSAGDLIPVTGLGRNWTPSGKCLVIRDIISSKMTSSSSSEDSSSSGSTPTSSTEDLRLSQSSDGNAESAEDCGDNFEFSLVDEVDEDDVTDEGSGDDDDDKINSEDKSASSGPIDDTLASALRIGLQKQFDLRRLALQNSQHKKSILKHAGATSSKEIVLPTNQKSPKLTSSPASVQHAAISAPFVVPHVGTSDLISAAMGTSTGPLITNIDVVPSTANYSALPSKPLALVATTTSEQDVASTAVQMELMYVAAQTPTAALPGSILPTVAQTTTSTTSKLASVSVTQPGVVSPDALTTTSPSATENNTSAGTFNIHHAEHPSSTYHNITGESNLGHLPEPSDLHLSAHGAAVVSRPASPCEMPWVMTSTKIADANVYVSSSHPPNSNMSIRSAHWISPRSVEGTIPINLEDAKAIRVETVDVPTNAEGESLQFQKVTYSSGFIISSAQWVAPTEGATEHASSNETRPLPSVHTADRQSDSPKASNVPPLLSTTDSAQSSPSRKLRKKYIVETNGVVQRPVLYASDKLSGGSSSSTARRSPSKLVMITVKDENVIGKDTDLFIPQVADSRKNGAYPRQSKRRFDVEKVLDVPQPDLGAELMFSNLTLSSSPTSSKRRFVVEKVLFDPLDKSALDLKRLSAKLDLISSPGKEVKDYSLENTPEDENVSSPRHTESANHDINIPQSITGGQMEMPQCLNTKPDIPQNSNPTELPLEHLNQNIEPPASTNYTELSNQLMESSASIDGLNRRHSPGRHTKFITDTEDDERFAKENDALLQMILTSISETEASSLDNNNHGGGSTVAIDNKIEQAMDLVKRHLMYAVREEVEILKQQIGEMMDRIGQLEYENTVLRSEAKPETLNKLLQPRLAQPPQAALPAQSQIAAITAAPAQQQAAAPHVQPTQQQQTALSQVGQPPSTT